MTLQTKYYSLREEFISIAQPCVQVETLRAIKNNYAECIDSRRKLGHINDLKGLIKVLEKRDILNYDNIEPLCYISKKFLNNPYLEKKLTAYTSDLQEIGCLPLYNMYQHDNVAFPLPEKCKAGNQINSITNCTVQQGPSQVAPVQSVASISQNVQNQCRLHMPSSTPHVDREQLLQQTVLSRISERLGRSWRDVARHLGIRECEIDAIQNKYPYDLKEQSYEALKTYISQHGNSKWNLNLMRALEKGRRKDLTEIVEELTIHQRADDGGQL